MTRFSSKTDQELADGICTWAGRIAAGEAEMLAWIAEFDRREAWGGVGLLSCGQWLAWRIGLSPGAARERVRIARALEELPDVQQAYAAGRLSYSQVRAITRAATPEDQQRWIDLARCSTAGQLERLVRGVRRAIKPEQDTADPELASWQMRARKSFDADGNAVYTIVLPAEQAAVLDAAVEVVRSELDAAAAAKEQAGVSAETPLLPAPRAVAGDLDTGPTGSRRSTVAAALLAMAQRVLDAPATQHASARRARAGLTVHVDPLTGWARLRDGELLPPTSLSGIRNSRPGRERPLRPLTSADLRRHDLGRDRRLPTPALRELLGTLDGERCRFPGCTRHRKLHAHHVTFWRNGGRTDLDNLLLLCGRHHTLVHAQGFQLQLAADRSLHVTTADGNRVLHHPALPWRPAGELDPDHHVSAETLPPDDVAARMDLGYAVMVLSQQAA